MTVRDRRGLVMATESILTRQFRVWLNLLRTRTVQSSLLAQEPNLPLRVAPDKAHNHSLLLTALEAVDATQLDAGESVLERSQRRQLIRNGSRVS